MLSLYGLLFIHLRYVLKTDMWQRRYEKKKQSINCVIFKPYFVLWNKIRQYILDVKSAKRFNSTLFQLNFKKILFPNLPNEIPLSKYRYSVTQVVVSNDKSPKWWHKTTRVKRLNHCSLFLWTLFHCECYMCKIFLQYLLYYPRCE